MDDKINQINITMEGFRKDIGYIKHSLDENKTEHKEILDRIDAWFKTAEDKFANKWVEKVAIAIGSVVGLAIIGAVLSLIIIK